MDNVFRALGLATQSVNILHYSLIYPQFLLRFAAVTNKEISQLIKQAVPKIGEESDE